MSEFIGFIFIIIIIVNVILKFAGLVSWSWWRVFWPIWVDMTLTIIEVVRYLFSKWINDNNYF